MFLDRSLKSTIDSPLIASSELISGRASDVITAFTPGMAWAAVVSIDRILACACGLRSTTPISIPGRW